MPDKKSGRIIIPRKGVASGEQQARGIYSEITDKAIGNLGEKQTARASHVEPGSELSQEALDKVYPKYSFKRRTAPSLAYHYQVRDECANKWFADMSPVSGPVLGPYDDREDALADEVEWLHAHNIPTCRSCADTPTE